MWFLFLGKSLAGDERNKMQKNWTIEPDFILKEVKRNDIEHTKFFLFYKENILIYKVLCEGNSMERSYFNRKKFDKLSVVEYDLDKDGIIDGIRVAEDDLNFHSFLVTKNEGEILIRPFPKDWRNLKEILYDNDYDSFFRYIKYIKNMK